MEFFNQSITVLQTLVVAIGAGLGVWGVVNLMEGYGNDNPGAQVEGQKGTWTVTDEKTIDEQRFVLMVNDQKPDLLPSIVVQSDGKFITSAASGFDNATVRKVRELLHHEKFLKNGTAERARESGTEQNYNMIDGCVNNVPKKPRVIGGRVSVLDRLHIKQAERARKDNAQVQQQERTRKN